jgi:tellurite resistance protein TerC
MLHTVAQPWMWVAFIAFVLAMLAMDVVALGWFTRPGQRQGSGGLVDCLGHWLSFDFGLWIYLTETVGREMPPPKPWNF